MPATLDDLLLEEGVLDHTTLLFARREGRRTGLGLARILIEQRKIAQGELAELLVRRLHLPRVDPEHLAVDEEALRAVPYPLAERRWLLPLGIERVMLTVGPGERGLGREAEDAGREHRDVGRPRRDVIRVAMADPLDRDAVEEIELSTGCAVHPLVAPAEALGDAIQRSYRTIITKTIPRPVRASSNEPRAAPPEPGGPRDAVPDGPRPAPPEALGPLADRLEALDATLRVVLNALAARGLLEDEAVRAAVSRLKKP